MRGRPRGFDRDAALAAATELFWRRGYEGTSVSELTEAMGIRPGSLYAAFGDKRALFAEVVRSYGQSPAGAFMTAAFEEEPSARDAFARILRDAASIYSDPAHPAGCLTISAATNVTAQEAEVEAFLRELRNSNLALFRAKLRAGGVPEVLAGYFAAVVQGMSQRARDGATGEELLETARLAMAVWPADSQVGITDLETDEAFR